MDKTFKWTIPCNPKDWTIYVEKCEAEIDRLTTEGKRLERRDAMQLEMLETMTTDIAQREADRIAIAHIRDDKFRKWNLENKRLRTERSDVLAILAGGKGLEVDTFQTRNEAALDILSPASSRQE